MSWRVKFSQAQVKVKSWVRLWTCALAFASSWRVNLNQAQAKLKNDVDFVHALLRLFFSWRILFRQTKVIGIDKNEYYSVQTTQGVFESKCVINCTGLNGVDVAKYQDPNSEHQLEFRKGEYQVSDIRDESYLNHVIYPMPSNLLQWQR